MKTRVKIPNINDRFGYWVVKSIPDNPNSVSFIEVVCTCGNSGSVMLSKLLNGKSTKCKSCSNRLNTKSRIKTKPYSLIDLQVPVGFNRYNKHIYVSKGGEVFSTKSGLLKPSGRGGSNGEYLRVNIGNKCEYIHRLVGSVYLPKEPGRCEINHIDKDTFNNTVENLEWVTSSENKLHALGVQNYKG